MNQLKILIVLSLLLISTAASADKYFGIYPTATLTEIKSLYPNAEFNEIRPAWLKDRQRFLKITGEGIDGIISIILYDDRIAIANTLNPLKNKINDGLILTKSENYVFDLLTKSEKKYLNNKEDPWVIEEIRWTPPRLIKLDVLIKKYGKPNREYIDESLNLFKVWDKDNLINALINDKKHIELVTYSFSDIDYMCISEWREGRNCVPLNFMKDKNKYKKKLK